MESINKFYYFTAIVLLPTLLRLYVANLHSKPMQLRHGDFLALGYESQIIQTIWT